MAERARFDTVPDVARHWGEKDPARVALKWSDGTITYDELYRQSVSLARSLNDGGAQSDRPVAYLGANSPAVFLGWFAASLSGSAFAALNWRLPATELAVVLEDLGAAIIFADGAHLQTLSTAIANLPEPPRVVTFDAQNPLANLTAFAASQQQAALPTLSPDMTALIAYTSGTTGVPKGVRMSHTAFVTTSGETGGPIAMDWNADDRVVMAMPNFHLGGSFISFRALAAGATVLILPTFEPKAIFDVIAQEHATVLPLVPTALTLLLDSPEMVTADVSSLREIVYFGSSIGATTVRRALDRFNCDLMQYYGATETWVITMLDGPSHDPERPELLASCGVPIRGVEVRLVDPQGADIAEGEIGEVVVRSSTMFDGYWRNDEATKAAFVDGWYRTGDLARRSADGYLAIVDRAKDMIVSGGENIYSAEVERALQSCAGIAMCAVIGVADDRWGERVEAFVTAMPGTTLDAETVRAECRERIAGYKVPKVVHVVDTLPLTPSGKVHKPSLRAETA